MKDNLDNQQVVLAREMYDALMKFAEEGAKHIKPYAPVFELPRIKWHARKFNKGLREARKPEVVAEQIEIKRGKARASWVKENLINRRKPKKRRSVWVSLTNPILPMIEFFQTRVRGVQFSHEKGRWVAMVWGGEIPKGMLVDFDQIYLELPDGIREKTSADLHPRIIRYMTLPWSRPDGTKP